MKTQCEVWGILNITPDSFRDGGSYLDPKKALAHAEEMINAGAAVIDIGGQSTRPGAQFIPAEEEWVRIESTVKELIHRYPEQVSVDTFHSVVVEYFLRAGGTIINAVAGCQDPVLVELIAKYEATVVVNHFPGKDIKSVHEQQINSIEEVRNDLLRRKKEMVRMGIDPEKIILDPGIGFGKTMELNWQLLDFAHLLPDEKIMIGHSCKRFLGEERFETKRNLEAARIAIESGTQILRVHEVAPHVRLVQDMNV